MSLRVPFTSLWTLTTIVGTWFAFKYAFRRKAEKLERTNLNYGALARVTRDRGFLVLLTLLHLKAFSDHDQIILIIRLSVIPSHFSTAVFSTCNVNFWYFAIATFLTLPKQIIVVYFGVLIVQESKDNTISDIVLVITFLITLVAGAYIYLEMRNTKKILLAEQATRLNANQNISKVFSFDANIDMTEAFRQEERSSRRANSPRPPTPTWQEGMYEMDDIGKQRVRIQEFI